MEKTEKKRGKNNKNEICRRDLKRPKTTKNSKKFGIPVSDKMKKS